MTTEHGHDDHDMSHDMSHDAAPEAALRRSDQDTSGDMGVSSEREGHTGPGQRGTTGLRRVDPIDDVQARADAGELPPEFRPGAPETNPVGIEPKAAYPSLDPRSRDD